LPYPIAIIHAGDAACRVTLSDGLLVGHIHRANVLVGAVAGDTLRQVKLGLEAWWLEVSHSFDDGPICTDPQHVPYRRMQDLPRLASHCCPICGLPQPTSRTYISNDVDGHLRYQKERERFREHADPANEAVQCRGSYQSVEA